MIKGVNKRIIEINNIDNDFFDKAIFFVKSENNQSYERLQKEANKVVQTYFSSTDDKSSDRNWRYTTENKNNRKILGLALIAFSLLLTIGLGCLILQGTLI